MSRIVKVRDDVALSAAVSAVLPGAAQAARTDIRIHPNLSGRTSFCPICAGPKSRTAMRCRDCFVAAGKAKAKAIHTHGIQKRHMAVSHRTDIIDQVPPRPPAPSAHLAYGRTKGGRARGGHTQPQPAVPRWVKLPDGSWTSRPEK